MSNKNRLNMTIAELSKTIFNDIFGFDKLMRDHFDFDNVRILHKDIVDYGKMNVDEEDNYISITMHDCAEIQDHIFLSLVRENSDDIKLEWNGINFYAYQYIDEMD